ncbi:MAG: DUF4923 family protein [Odoribacter sp.]|nr:DUF4923 family protein [Odoribacter sp.]
MKRFLITMTACGMLAAILPVRAQAQSLKDILKSETAQKILNVVKEATAFKFQDLEGTWKYQSPACQFKSDELLQKAGGTVLANEMEGKLEAAYKKAGITPGSLSYTFNRDSTFTCTIGKKQLKGTYDYDTASKTLTLTYYRLLKSEIQLAQNSEGIAMLYDADRLLKVVTLLSSISKSAMLSTVGKVAEQYDGMLLGFDMKKQ